MCESVFVSVCMCLWEREREGYCVCMRGSWIWSVCLCVCEREKEESKRKNPQLSRFVLLLESSHRNKWIVSLVLRSFLSSYCHQLLVKPSGKDVLKSDGSDMHVSWSMQLKCARTEAIFDLLEAGTKFLFSYFEPRRITDLTNCNVKDNQRNWLIPLSGFFGHHFMVIYGIEFH